MNQEKNHKFRILVWLLEGAIVGFGAILPGVSGAALCVAFGMYLPIIEVFSKPKENLKKHAFMLSIFIIGGGLGFVGLSGFASYLMSLNAELVVCAFIGFIIGTFPELWQDAGKEGRSKASIVTVVIGFVTILAVLITLRNLDSLSVSENTFGYLFCGILWGLSFIVPGLSSSTLIMFLGLYQPMLDGISSFNFSVLIPLGIGVLACVLLLSRAISALYKKHFSILSHFIIGAVAATTVMIFPGKPSNARELILWILIIPCGAVISYFLTCICANLKK